MLAGSLDRDPAYVEQLQARITRLGYGHRIRLVRRRVGRRLPGPAVAVHRRSHHPGRPGPAGDFARANIVAFERNGFGPVSAGGFESCDWLISGGGASVAIPWDGRIGAGRDDHILASGNIRGADPVSPGDPLTKDSFT